MLMLNLLYSATLSTIPEYPFFLNITRRIFFRDVGNRENDGTGLSHCHEFVIDKLINKILAHIRKKSEVTTKSAGIFCQKCRGFFLFSSRYCDMLLISGYEASWSSCLPVGLIQGYRTWSARRLNCQGAGCVYQTWNLTFQYAIKFSGGLAR